MKSYSIRVSKIDREDAFKELALETGGELEESNTLIKFSGEIGRGQIKKYHLDAGLYMRVWDLFLVKPVELIKEASQVYIADNGFGLLCIQTPESVDLKSINEHQQYHKVRERRFALAPESVNEVLQLHPQLPIRFIDFTISAYWLKQQPGYLNIARYFDDGFTEERAFPVLMEHCQPKANMLAGKLIEFIEDKKADPAVMLPIAEALIKEFLNATSKDETEKANSHIDLYYDKIKEAEAILIAHLQKSPPRLSAIAKTVALSESTLKRYFKIIYGKSIYEYYLSRKMELARTIMMQRPHTVNEIAEMMGYEKVSHFIEIFKKHHGFSPGSIKKKQIELLSS
jgi:AraC-like DNA-binding protein